MIAVKHIISLVQLMFLITIRNRSQGVQAKVLVSQIVIITLWHLRNINNTRMIFPDKINNSRARVVINLLKNWKMQYIAVKVVLPICQNSIIINKSWFVQLSALEIKNNKKIHFYNKLLKIKKNWILWIW